MARIRGFQCMCHQLHRGISELLSTCRRMHSCTPRVLHAHHQHGCLYLCCCHPCCSPMHAPLLPWPPPTPPPAQHTVQSTARHVLRPSSRGRRFPGHGLPSVPTRHHPLPQQVCTQLHTGVHVHHGRLCSAPGLEAATHTHDVTGAPAIQLRCVGVRARACAHCTSVCEGVGVGGGYSVTLCSHGSACRSA